MLSKVGLINLYILQLSRLESFKEEWVFFNEDSLLATLNFT